MAWTRSIAGTFFWLVTFLVMVWGATAGLLLWEGKNEARRFEVLSNYYIVAYEAADRIGSELASFDHEHGHADGVVPPDVRRLLSGSIHVIRHRIEEIQIAEQKYGDTNSGAYRRMIAENNAFVAAAVRDAVETPGGDTLRKVTERFRNRADQYSRLRKSEFFSAREDGRVAANVEHYGALMFLAVVLAVGFLAVRLARKEIRILEGRSHAAEQAMRKSEERLRQSQKMEAVGQLTGGIAHEFNNLLQVIMGNLELLQGDLPAGGETGRRFQAISRNVSRGADLTDRLLSFSRQQPLAPSTVEMATVLAEMRGMLGQTLGETIEVKVEPAGDVWRAVADLGQLENALLNLAINARDAMPNGGVITLSANNIRLDEQAVVDEEATPGDYVVLSVTDTGSGMTDENISHAFEPFFTTKDVGKGTGLGLSMVYGFARQSGGFAEIKSEVGRGTSVRLYLPRLIRAEDDEIAPQDRQTEAALPGSGTILVVEDDADVRESLTDQLIGMGYRVIEAEDGDAALAVLAGVPQIDLLFTDVVMPGGMSGLELARQIQSLRPEIRVLYSTGYSDDIVSEAEHFDNDLIMLRKPFAKAELAAMISKVLN
ncbi:MAG: response regulator [Rhodospirillaceae bacterium]|jgi:signal transduction histidine kinase|nr:response regulator [Rhodospirillaceae bacterium]MBT4688206.1 response regulator [Rhodospirillaceae bacterium]MBT5079199.1 response regulator [Rhodospirillaceae bacterium]MBT5522517.1 response regulator [Rhodospirillaceae bacterium]MBT5877576.1 response regulator [Rhodospirillaceae bacterium]